MEKADILNIIKTDKTVFSFKDILLSSGKNEPALLRRRLNYYVKHDQLYHIRRGLYAKDNNYNALELATKIFTPSYVSFETVLINAGIVFQGYSQIFAATYQTKELTCDDQTFVFKKLKDNILTNNNGILNKDNYWIATPERAMLDVLYLNRDYHFDNLTFINWDLVSAFLPIYQNKRMSKKIEEYYRDFKSGRK
jgi:hypothetical protein